MPVGLARSFLGYFLLSLLDQLVEWSRLKIDADGYDLPGLIVKSLGMKKSILSKHILTGN